MPFYFLVKEESLPLPPEKKSKQQNKFVKKIMAQHQSAKKRIRQDEVKRLRNRYYKKSARSAIAKLREMEDASAAQSFLPKVISMIDSLAKRNTWHNNKASNLKSSLTKHVNGLS